MDELDARFAELQKAAVEECILPSETSEGDLRGFCLAFGEPDAVFLLDNGNYRARWVRNGLHTGIEFKGEWAATIIQIPHTPSPQQQEMK